MSVTVVYSQSERQEVCSRSGNSDVVVHAMPGGQNTNLQYQAFKLGLGANKWPAIKRTYYATANTHLLGDIVKVTPSSKVVGDLSRSAPRSEQSGRGVVP